MWITNFFPFFTVAPAQSRKWSKYENDIEFQNTFMNLINLAVYAFEFTGLPETCNERYFKLNLVLNGMAGIANDPERGFLTLKALPAGSEWNIYGECSKVFGYGWNGFNKEYTNYMYGSDNSNADFIICRDNEMCYPLVNYIIMYANRLTSCMRTLDVTSRKLKNPYFITCDEAQKTSIKKILEDIDYNVDSIITNKSTTPNMFQILQTGVNPESLRTLWNHYANLDSQIRSLLGINSANNEDKSERLLVDEVNADNDIAFYNVDHRLKCYQLFCETCNEHFGLDLSVRLRFRKENTNGSQLDRYNPGETL